MYVVVEGQEQQFKGIFKTSELARLWAEQQPSSHLEVLEVIPNYPEQTKHMFGPFAGNGHRTRNPEEIEETPEEEAPKTEAETDAEAAEEAPETTEETAEASPAETTEEAPPKPKRTRKRITAERVQECCDTIIDMMEPGEPYKRKFFLDETDVTAPEWTKVIKVLLESNQLRQEGVKKGACYFLVEDEEPETEEVEEAVEATEEDTDNEE